MLILDNITIVICIILVISALCSSLFDTFLKKMFDKEETDSAENLKPVSVVIISDNNSVELDNNLKYFLSQDYFAGYEIIVVVSRDEDGTADVLKTYNKYKNLYTTFVPETSRYMSRRKLAITLGVKAAKNDLILLTDAVCKPVSNHWIEGMSTKCRDGINLVIGYSNYSDDTGQFKTFYRLHKEYTYMYEAFKGFAYSTYGNNLLFKKADFMSGRGFQGNLKYVRGEYDFLVNKYSKFGSAAIAISKDVMLVEDKPSKKAWNNKNTFYFETRKHLQRSFRHRQIFNMDVLGLYLCFILVIFSVIYSVLSARFVILPFSFMALVVPFISRIICAKRVLNRFNADVSLWKVIPFELALPFSNFRFAIKYILSDKYEYISHKS